MDKDIVLNRLGITDKDFNKARKEFNKAWEIACKYCEKDKGLPIFVCTHCPLVNTAENFRIYDEE